jgi:hypothetical protein
MALCAVKPHLFLFMPVALLAQKKYRALVGLMLAGAALYLLSWAMLGPDWPVIYLRAVTANEATIRPPLLGISGIVSHIGQQRWLLASGVLTGAAIAYWWTRSMAWLPAMAFTVTAGIAFGPRSMVYDAAFFLPLLLLYLSPLTAAIVGAAIVTVLTPGEWIAIAASIAVIFLPRVETENELGPGAPRLEEC